MLAIFVPLKGFEEGILKKVFHRLKFFGFLCPISLLIEIGSNFM